MAKPLRSWNLACPACGAGSGETSLTLDVNDLRHGVTCSQCGETTTVESAVALATERLAAWIALEKWIALAGGMLTSE